MSYCYLDVFTLLDIITIDFTIIVCLFMCTIVYFCTIAIFKGNFSVLDWTIVFVYYCYRYVYCTCRDHRKQHARY